VGFARPDAVFGNPSTTGDARNGALPLPGQPSPALLEAAAKNGWGYFRPAAAEGVEAAVAGE